MGSLTTGARLQADTRAVRSTRTPASRSARRPRPPLVAALFAAAWVVPLLTQLTRTDPLLVVLAVFGTGGLVRAGATIVDRLVITLVLLFGAAMAGGLLFSVWPWGLQPVAVGGLGLTLLVGAYLWLGARPPWHTWPRRMLGTDVVLLAGLVAGTLVAYWPSLGGGVGNRLGFAGMTGDRLRHFSLFDTIHSHGGYTFLMQGQVKGAVDPGMLAVYPPGQHYLYALGDIFLRSSVNPGNAVAELDRYNVWVSLGYGFFVAAVAWAARWAAGPFLAGWQRVLLVTAITGYLTVGSFTSAIWCTWDPQVLGMALLAVLAAVCFRPPTGWRTHAALMALLFLANCLTYEGFAPFAAIMVAVSLAVHRRRLLPHWKPLLVVAVVTLPMALSEYIAAHAAGLSDTSAAQATGFTILFSWIPLTVTGAASLLGFATRAARRRPSAVAGLCATLLSAVAVLVFLLDARQPLADDYYFQKFVQAWVVIMMVTAGCFGHLLRRPVLPRRGLAGFGAGLAAFALAVVATHSFWWSAHLVRPATPAGDPNPGASWSVGRSSTWASVWMSTCCQVPDNIPALGNLAAAHQLADGIPTVAVVYGDASSNVDLSLQLAVLNRDAGTMSAVIYGSATDQDRGLNATADLADVGRNGAAWTAERRHELTELEAGIKAVGTPVRVIVASQPLRTALTAWSRATPGAIRDVVYEPNILTRPRPGGARDALR
ncbi:hypothetical protein [Streptacidiphilus sp. P02-A3a]|uniref:hypothetical protein n=1 Tax=Streptacidiphilus sp. P02-A3a TaxID=2704468 RepID=UPI0015FC1128|nr:hypothetical protein [Streptacidiphilus sp. P02-A3a]QMU71532.1 hypothetical protein GXP74_28160 [Streptacidiphilus sp. P02-A3a]